VQYYFKCSDGAKAEREKAQSLPDQADLINVNQNLDMDIDDAENSDDVSAAVADAYTKITDEDIERAQLMRTEARDRLHGESAVALGYSVAEVQFRTDAENQNHPNRTNSSVQFWFSPATPVVSSVLGSQISRVLRTGSEPVRTGPNCYYFKQKSQRNN
jgi:hypothetical protein